MPRLSRIATAAAIATTAFAAAIPAGAGAAPRCHANGDGHYADNGKSHVYDGPAGSVHACNGKVDIKLPSDASNKGHSIYKINSAYVAYTFYDEDTSTQGKVRVIKFASKKTVHQTTFGGIPTDLVLDSNGLAAFTVEPNGSVCDQGDDGCTTQVNGWDRANHSLDGFSDPERNVDAGTLRLKNHKVSWTYDDGSKGSQKLGS